MLLPEAVQNVQHDALLEELDVRPHLRRLLFIGGPDGANDALAESLLGQFRLLVQPFPHRQAGIEFSVQRLLQAGDVPLLFYALGRHKAVHHLVDHILPERLDGLRDVLRLHQVQTLAVDHLPLVVGHIVVFQQLLADVEVAPLHLALRLLYGAGDHPVLYGLALLHAQPLHEAAHPVRGEDAHEVVLQRQVEAGIARVPLAAGAATQLVVDAPAFVPLGADDMQAAGVQHLLVVRLPLGADGLHLLLAGGLQPGDLRFPIAAQDDVGAPPGHVGGDGHRAGPPGLGDDFRLPLVHLGVQHAVLDFPLLEKRRELFGSFNGCRAHQHGRAPREALGDFLGYGVELLVGGEEHQVVQVAAHHGQVGGHHHHIQAVDLAELEGFGVRRAGHAAQLAVQAKVVLEGGGGQRLALVGDGHPLLGLYGLVDAAGPAAPGHGAPGVLVNNDHLPVLDDVFHIPAVEAVRLQRRLHMVQQHEVAGAIEALARRQEPLLRQQVLHLLVAAFGELHIPLLFVNIVVARRLPPQRQVFGSLLLALQLRDEAVDGLIDSRAALHTAGNDERRPRLVNEDGVHLVHNGEVQPPLDLLRQGESHVVAQVVKAELVVGAIGDVRLVGGPLVGRRLLANNHADAHAEPLIDGAHPFGSPTREVVVDCDQMHPFARDGVQVERQGGDQRLALASAHLGNAAFVQGYAAEQLHIEDALAQGPLRRLAHGRKGFRQERLQRLAGVMPLAEAMPEAGQRLIGERFHGSLVTADGGHQAAHAPEFTLVLAAEQPAEGLHHHAVPARLAIMPLPPSVKSTRALLDEPGEELGPLVAKARRLLGLEPLVQRFTQGEVKVAGLEDGCLTLVAATSAHASRLRYEQRAIIQGLEGAASLGIQRIRVLVKPDVFQP